MPTIPTRPTIPTGPTLPAVPTALSVTSSALEAINAKHPGPLSDRNCPICLGSLTECQSSDDAYPVVRLHAPVARSTTLMSGLGRRANGLSAGSGKSESPDCSQVGQDNRQHLLHFQCAVKLIARNGKPSAGALLSDYDFRCPICNTASKLTQITPYQEPNVQSSQAKAPPGQCVEVLRGAVDAERKALPISTSRSASRRSVQPASHAYYGVRHGLLAHPNIYGYGSMPTASRRGTYDAEVSPNEQMSFGGVLLCLSLFTLGAHAPPVFCIVTAIFGSAAFGSGAIQACINEADANDLNEGHDV